MIFDGSESVELPDWNWELDVPSKLIVGHKKACDFLHFGYGHSQHRGWVISFADVIVRIIWIMLLTKHGDLVLESKQILHVATVSQQLLLPYFVSSSLVIFAFPLGLDDIRPNFLDDVAVFIHWPLV